ncbi:unnamed protein product [Lactuca saligna]|uniref:Transposase MuDR plant domain-containing protein n=1 Tax=Lactuca saligna TaxID=75948 RepID=A0AA35VG49_LACSI|nr:unnamed protein product [Lactuca saligna]
MASNNDAKKKTKKKKYADYEDLEDEILVSDMPMDYEREKVITVSFQSVKDPFLTKLFEDESEFFGEKDEYVDDLVHLEDDENDILGSNSVHDPTIEWNLMEPKVGEKYQNFSQLKNCLINYAVAHGYPLRFEKLESTRLVARCGRDTDKKKCDFRLYASWMNTERTVQVKSMKKKHSCSRKFTFGHLVSPQWIASHLVKEIVFNLSIKLKEPRELIRTKFKITLSLSKCNRAKHKAMVMIEGKASDHYARIWDYAAEIQRSNPGSTVQVGVNLNPDGKHYFHRFYVCFHALKTGWIAGCRRVIGLDGCFLKGQAVVDIENKQNWKWFLELLSEDVGVQEGGGLTVISDQHKGLLEAVKEVLLYAEHRQCVRHIYANFKKSYKGEEYKDLFWAAAGCTVEPEFISVMERLKAIDVGAYEYLMSHNPSSWSRAYFCQEFLSLTEGSIVMLSLADSLFPFPTPISRLFLNHRFWWDSDAVSICQSPPGQRKRSLI